MKTICFVDDDPKEIQRVETHLGTRFHIGAGQTLDEALGKLGGRKPDLFVLDLYYPDRIPPSDSELIELHQSRAAYLAAEREFQGVLARLGQSAEGGFRRARDVQARFRRPVAFYTRKGTLEDAIVAYEDVRVATVIKKPDPIGIPPGADALGKAYDDALRDSAPAVEEHLNRAITRSSWRGRNQARIEGFVLGVLASLVAAAIWAVVARAG